MHGVRVILDFPDPTRNGPQRLRFGPPLRVITATTTAEVQSALREAEQHARDGAHVAGFVAYEAAPAFDPAFTTHPPAGPAPLLWFGVFDPPAVHDSPARAPAPASLSWRTRVHRAAYDHAIGSIRDAIAAGDVYQVNHTIRFTAPCATPPLELYDALVAQRHGSCHALIETPDWAIVSASPELFLDVQGDHVTTRPMKGTSRRGRWLHEDRDAASRLAASAKDRAENLMIVDLLRNDLGRVARFGSVAVPAMYDIERYPTVHQMTSTITARLRDDAALTDLFAATFPCGSVTGAPKIAAMQMITRLEDAPRGPYCGAIGVMRPDGSATFNVAIRTLVVDRTTGTAVYGAGGGITWDSVAAAEYDEVVAKAALLSEHIPDFALLETLRLQDGVLHRLDLHLARVAESACYWGFDPAVRDAVTRALEVERTAAPAGAWRIRATATRDAMVTVTRSPLADEDAALSAREHHPRTFALAATPISSTDRLLFHKTTARDVYDEHRARHPDAFDVLLYNERGEITEFTTGNVVCEIDGRLVTPSRHCGLLAGTWREQLLRAGLVTEAVITIPMLRAATRVLFVNSVRGELPVSEQRPAVPDAPQR